MRIHTPFLFDDMLSVKAYGELKKNTKWQIRPLVCDYRLYLMFSARGPSLDVRI